MYEKTKVRVSNSGSSPSRVAGLGLLLVAFIIFLAGVVLILITRISPRLDKQIVRPAVESMPAYVSEVPVTVSGDVVDGISEVIIYVNDKKESSSVEVSEGKFSYDYTPEEEGEYKFEVAAVKSGLLKSRSEKSDPVTTTYDVTPPSADIEFEYPAEINAEAFDLSGTTESGAKVTVKKEGEEFSATAGDDGKFNVTAIPLVEGENEFAVEITDPAGNVAQANDLVKVIYSKDADLNGEGVMAEKPADEPAQEPVAPEESSQTGETGEEVGEETGASEEGDEELPNSAGELEAAMDILGMRNLMAIFALIALAVFAVNSGLVVGKLVK
ncbi:hypothetical protein GF357_05025 [Candidatus Dojkabacteria bacterium]|nr:hypothetical protein [Candidatus Dojkabacteria bacterium]